MQQPRRSLSASNLPVNTNSSNNNNNTNNNNNGSSNTPVVESVHQDKRINYHELMQMLGTENLQHASLMMGTSMHPNNVDPTTPLSANSHHHLASFVHPNATAQMSTTQLLLEELNSAVDHTHHQATLQMLASGTNTESNNSNAPTTNGNSIVNNGSTAALLSAAAGHHPYHYYPSQYSPYLYHPLSHPIHPIHFSSHTPLAALYDQSAAAAVLLQQQQLLNHSLHSLPTASSTATINPQQQQQQSTATVQQPTTTISNNNTVSNVVVNQNIPSQQTSQNVQNITSNTDEEIEDDSDSKPMDCKKEGDNTSECEENREWSNCQVNRDFLDSSNVQVNIYLETRDSGPRNDSIVESELYSSIKYEMRHEIKCLKFLNESDNDLQLFCRVQIIHPDNKNEVLKNGKTILGGVVESNVSKGNANENIASTSMKIKFTDCSYHHGNCKFAFRVSYFIESDLDNPILIKESASFKVLARKPSKNKTKKQASKRKRKEEEAEINTVTTTTTPQSSPQKVKISSFDDFKQVTTSVFDYIQTNTDEQKKRQMINYVITKLYSVDPNIMFSLPTDDGANDIFKGLL